MDKRTLLLLSLISFVSSYDTGHHSDLTRNAMEILGYNGNAQLVGAISNWFVDYFSYTPSTSAVENLKSMHFDNLFHMVNVSNYMTQLVLNTMNATRYAVQTNDPVTFLAIMGASCHAVQDFYTHSSWAEHHQTSCGCYRDETWFSELYNANGNLSQLFDKFQSVATYSWGNGCNEFERNCLPGQIIHGGYCEGINKDSYVRPWFERSYGHAMAATIEWIYNMQNWAIGIAGNSDLVNSAKAYQPASTEDLQKDYEASIKVSYATKVPLDGEEDGHYKGAGSGDTARLVSASASFSSSSSIYKKKFTDERVWQYLTYPNLYDVPNYDQRSLNETLMGAMQFITPYTQIPSVFTDLKKIKVRTVSVSASKTVGRPSPYAVVTVGGMQFYEAVQQNIAEFNPHWTTLKYVPASTEQVDIQYVLWDDQFPASDELKPVIGGGDGTLNFGYNVATHALSGSASGIFDTRQNPFSTSSSGNSVSLYITTENAGGCAMNGLPEPYCPGEAYTELLVHHGCTDYENDEDSGSKGLGLSMALVSSLLIFFAF